MIEYEVKAWFYMIVYHGSSEILKAPVYGKGSKTNDYGRGFYCTKSAQLAKEWACPTVKDGFANQYELDLSDLKVLYLNKEGYNILNWLAILLRYRTFPIRSPIARQANQYILEEFFPDISGYDVIWGYRADNSYFSFAKDFINNTISVNQLAQAMKLGELGEQIVLMSPYAFERIHFIGYEIADGSIYNQYRKDREDSVRKAYLSEHGANIESGENGLFVRDIISGKVKNHDVRL